MNIALWIAQGLLAFAFAFSGGQKLITPRDKAIQRMPYVEDFPDRAMKLIGVLEILGALGLVLPGATGIVPVLTPVAAVGLGLLMVGAMIVHGRRREWQALPINLVLLVIAVFVAWGRFGPYAF